MTRRHLRDENLLVHWFPSVPGRPALCFICWKARTSAQKIPPALEQREAVFGDSFRVLRRAVRPLLPCFTVRLNAMLIPLLRPLGVPYSQCIDMGVRFPRCNQNLAGYAVYDAQLGMGRLKILAMLLCRPARRIPLAAQQTFPSCLECQLQGPGPPPWISLSGSLSLCPGPFNKLKP